MMPPTTTAQQYPSAAPEPTTQLKPARPSRFSFFFGLVATLLTLGAITLAVFAPHLTSAPTLSVPQGWQQAFNGNPGDSPGVWDNASGCAFQSEGLHVWSGSSCAFIPANSAKLTGGVLVVAQLAPAADVATSQDAGILLDGNIMVLITQQGDYKICQDPCDSTSVAARPLVAGSTIAWHSDAFIANQMAVLYNADKGSLSFYANGQFVTSVNTNISVTPTIALATSTSGEAMFTHVSIYAGVVG